MARFTLPTEDELIGMVFEDAGLGVSYDEKGRYYLGMVRLAGGNLRDIDFLQDESVRILLSGLKSGRGYTWNQMLSVTRAGQTAERRSFLEDLVFDLADKQILLRGVSLECPTCKLRTWYDFKSLGEHILCEGCRTPFQMVLDKTEYCYRANELFIRGIDQGAITVLLTALLLFNSCEVGLVWKAGCGIASEELGIKSDFDIVAMCDGGLVVAECKDNLSRDIEESPEKISDQISNSIRAANRINADLFVLSTLDEQIPQVVIDTIKRATASISHMNVLFLNRMDLERGWTSETVEEQGEKRRFIDSYFKRLPGWSAHCIEYDPEVKSGHIALG